MKCPICKRTFIADDVEDAGKNLPFCSARCKLIDLGRWLSGTYQIPVEPDDQDESDAPPSPHHSDD